MIIRELITVFGFEIDEQKLKRLDAAIAVSARGVRRLQADIEGIGMAIRGVGLGMTAFVTAPLALMGIGMVKAASNAEETANKFAVTFQGMRDESEMTANSFARDFGLSIDTSKELLSSTGDLLVGFGFQRQEALKLSDQVQRLAGDLASFQNIQGGAREAGTRLTKGILGETENLKLMGIAVNQGSKEFRAMVKQIMATEKVTERQAKVLAIFRIAVSQSQNAIGDFARTSQSFANQWKILQERIRSVAITFGNILLPVATKVVRFLIKVAEIFEKLPTPIKKIIVYFASFVAIMGPIIFILGQIITSFGFLILKFIIIRKILAFFGVTAFGLILKVFGFISGLLFRFSLIKSALIAITKLVAILTFKITLIVAAILAIAAVIALVIEDFYVWYKGGDSAIGLLLGRFENLRERIMYVIRTIGRAFKFLWEAITTGNRDMWEKFKEQLWILLTSFDKFLVLIRDKLKEVSEKLPEILGPALLKVFKIIFKVLKNIVIIYFTAMGNLIKFIIQDIISATKDLLTNTLTKNFPKIAKFFGIGQGKEKGGTPVARPLGAQLPPGALASSNTSRTNITENNIKLDTSVNLQIPPGTPADQEKFLETKARMMLEDALTKSYSQAINSAPVTE